MLLIGSLAPSLVAVAQEDFEKAPINYSVSEPDNGISRLQQKLDARETTLAFDAEFGYLKSVLTALDVPVQSQGLVFSKTSLQLRRISPRTPRALYFNDNVYIGYCQSGDVLEISAVDAQLGTVYYTLNQREPEKPPQFERRTDNCLVCHASSRTENIPGHLVRSLHVDRGGSPQFAAGSRNVNHTTPIEQRWGGWYVTGEHGAQKHLGNFILGDAAPNSPIDNAAGHNLTSLTDRLDTARYLAPHSDIVALMMLEHQVLVQNRITNASFTTRQALAYDEMMRTFLEKPAGERLESTTRRINQAGDRLVEALLFVEEAPLTAPIRGTSGYAEHFVTLGPRTANGQSLRELDLTRRMFKYPCSYLIYSEAFTKLPREMRDYVWQRLWTVLSGADESPKFAHLTTQDRQNILTILRETMPDLPTSWQPADKIQP